MVNDICTHLLAGFLTLFKIWLFSCYLSNEVDLKKVQTTHLGWEPWKKNGNFFSDTYQQVIHSLELCFAWVDILAKNHHSSVTGW